MPLLGDYNKERIIETNGLNSITETTPGTIILLERMVVVEALWRLSIF